MTPTKTTATTTTPRKTSQKRLKRGIRKNLPVPGEFGKQEGRGWRLGHGASVDIHQWTAPDTPLQANQARQSTS
jgi:hypothetical protein